MAIDWGTALPTALGAFISGSVGVAYSEYRSRREETKETRNWFERISRFAEEVENAIETYNSERNATQLITTCDNINPRVREHILTAPKSADRDFLDALRELRILTETVSEMESVTLQAGEEVLPDPEEETIEELRETAQSVGQRADNHAEEIGWL